MFYICFIYVTKSTRVFKCFEMVINNFRGQNLNSYNTIIYITKGFYCDMVADMDKELTEESNGKTLFIRFNITGETKKMFLDIKKYYNLRYNMETFRVLVKKVHDEIFKDK